MCRIRRPTRVPRWGWSAASEVDKRQLQELPDQLIGGDKEVEVSQVAVRCRGGEDLGAMPLETLYERLNSELSAKR